MKPIKFRSDLICGLLHNQGDHIGKLLRSLDVTTPITLCQGYGVAEDVPIRVLAYAVPLFRLARQLPKTTKIEFYWARYGAKRANHNPLDEKEEMRPPGPDGDLTMQIVDAYARAFHQGICGQVRVWEDERSPYDAEEAIKWLLTEAEEIATSVPSIAGFAGKRGGKRAFRYMVEHVLYMRDPIQFEGHPLPLLVNRMEYPRGHLMMVGGPSEKIFWNLRQEFLKRLPPHDQWKSHQFFTPIGELPPYYPQPGEPLVDFSSSHGLWVSDLQLADLLGHVPDSRGSPLLRDWLVLLQDVAGVERFTITPQTMRGSKEKEVLQEGLDRLLVWLRSVDLEDDGDIPSSH